MKLIFTIAIRYLFGKKTTNAINIITWISIVGMSIGTAALVLILSVFNGFESLLSGMLNTFNPDIKVCLAEGKYISMDSIDRPDLMQIKGIELISFTLEETSFFEYKGSQEVGIIKGVETNFLKTTGLDSSIVTGEAKLGSDVPYALLGSGMNTKLSINPSDGFTAIKVYMPSKISKGPLDKDFNTLQFYPSGSFSVGSDVDMQYVIVDFEAANELLELDNHFSSIEIKLTSGASESNVIDALKTELGKKFIIKNRYQQDEGFLKIMNIEKWISYLIACLTLLIIAFNLVGSLWMIVLEKKKDIAILKSMGLTKTAIKAIFLSLGLLVSFIGLGAGFILSLIMYWLQKTYGLISIPDGFLIDAYPIELRWIDFIIVTCTVMTIGYVASLLPSIRGGQVSAFVRQE
ncbi:MAG: ABC transporter permease [Saprospiraceae bacterium]|nr:ABC transporter permease [Saprospiraceae bacterium]